MAWKKNWSRGRSRSRKSPLRRAIARKADRRYNWVQALDSTCEIIELGSHLCDEDPQCASGAKVVSDLGTVGGCASPVAFNLFAPDLPDTTRGGRDESDDVTICRIVGGIYFYPLFRSWEGQYNPGGEDPQFPNCTQASTLAGTQNYFARWGLRKDLWVLNEAGDDYTPPERDPLVTTQWTDGLWLKSGQREKVNHFVTDVSFYCTGDVIGVCPNVQKTAQSNTTLPNWTMVTGSGTWAGATVNGDPAITTTCTEFAVTADNLPGGSHLRNTGAANQPFYLPLSSRRRIRLKEAEGLTLWFNYTAMDFFGTLIPSSGLHDFAVAFVARPHVKLLLET